MAQCLTQDRGVAGLSLTGGTAFCPERFVSVFDDLVSDN